MLKAKFFVLGLVIILLSFSAFGIIGDFNEDNCVKFDDFLIFADGFKKFTENGTYNATFDLDKDSKIGLNDFLKFAENYNKCEESLFILSEGDVVTIGGVDLLVTRVGTSSVILTVNKDIQLLSRGQMKWIGGIFISLIKIEDNKITIKVMSLEVYNLDLNQSDKILFGNWKIEFIKKGNNLSAMIYVFDNYLKELNSPLDTYWILYANQALLFQLVQYDDLNNHLKYRIKPFIFSDRCSCLDTQECKNNRCELKNISKKYGYLYVYEGNETYNPEWRKNAKTQLEDFSKGLSEITNGKIKFAVDILGEYKTDMMCWNPADKAYMEIGWNGNLFVKKLPGSDFDVYYTDMISKIDFDETYKDIKKVDCTKCSPVKTIVTGDQRDTFITLECGNKALMPVEHFKFLNKLKQSASENLSFNLGDYDGIFVVYGRLGRLLPEEDKNNIYNLCGPMVEDSIAGYSSLEFAENCLNYKGILDCRKINRNSPYYNTYIQLDKLKYSAPGWFSLIHEILHNFGAVDIYDTGFVFGIQSNRVLALKLDPNADYSIMGDKERECKSEECTQEEIDKLYLDKWNRRIIGIWD